MALLDGPVGHQSLWTGGIARTQSCTSRLPAVNCQSQGRGNDEETCGFRYRYQFIHAAHTRRQEDAAAGEAEETDGIEEVAVLTVGIGADIAEVDAASRARLKNVARPAGDGEVARGGTADAGEGEAVAAAA